MFSSQSTPAPVTVRLEARLLANSEVFSLFVHLTYRATDPYAVTADFHTGGGQVVTWVFARELLKSVSSTPNGTATSNTPAKPVTPAQPAHPRSLATASPRVLAELVARTVIR